MATEEQVDAWKTLHKQWAKAFQEMRDAQGECSEAFAACAKGQGAGPSLKQIETADKAWELEQKLSKELEQLSQNMRG